VHDSEGRADAASDSDSGSEASSISEDESEEGSSPVVPLPALRRSNSWHYSQPGVPRPQVAARVRPPVVHVAVQVCLARPITPPGPRARRASVGTQYEFALDTPAQASVGTQYETQSVPCETVTGSQSFPAFALDAYDLDEATLQSISAALEASSESQGQVASSSLLRCGRISPLVESRQEWHPTSSDELHTPSHAACTSDELEACLESQFAISPSSSSRSMRAPAVPPVEQAGPEGHSVGASSSSSARCGRLPSVPGAVAQQRYLPSAAELSTAEPQHIASSLDNIEASLAATTRRLLELRQDPEEGPLQRQAQELLIRVGRVSELVRVATLLGDSRASQSASCTRVNVRDLLSSLSPQEKRELVVELQQSGALGEGCHRRQSGTLREAVEQSCSNRRQSGSSLFLTMEHSNSNSRPTSTCLTARSRPATSGPERPSISRFRRSGSTESLVSCLDSGKSEKKPFTRRWLLPSLTMR